jgi:uncharacterized protein (DUF2236 family)
MAKGDEDTVQVATSVTYRVARERLVVIGWGRAILLQFAHPLVAAGVSDHSAFRAGRLARLRRLHQTIHAMLAITFGTERQSRDAVRRIRAIHDRVHGTLREHAGAFAAGTPYSAHDPQLLCWVHATLLDSSILIYEWLIGPLTAAEKDSYCEEARPIASALGIPERLLPRNVTELRSYMDRMLSSPEIQVTDTARALARDLLYPPLGTVLWPLARLNRLLTIGLLPPAIRESYGFRWKAKDQRALLRWTRRVRRIRRFMPAFLAHWTAARALEA